MMTGGSRLRRPLFLLTCILLLGIGTARADVFIQTPPDVDGADTDGDGIVDNDHVYLHMAAGDGFVNMADGKLMYCFGFSDVTGVPADDVMMAGMLGANFVGPTIVVREGQKLYLTLTNVGMMMRPDLFDPHTIHWHGFPNAAPIFDGVPTAAIAINMGASLTYFYSFVDPGTYMWHCHVEATEHMQMGMLAQCYVLPQQDLLADGADLEGFTHRTGYKYAYNDDDGSTYYDVDYPIQLGGFDPNFHEASLSVQPLPFAELKDTYPMLNGRGYPDTINPSPLPNTWNGKFSQKLSSLITADPGDRILLRLSNLSTTDYYTVTTLGIPMKVVGAGARLLRGPDGEDTSYYSNSLTLGGGEAADVILDTALVAPGVYFLYTTNLNFLSNNEEDRGGMMTEIVIGDVTKGAGALTAISPADGASIGLGVPPTFLWTYQDSGLGLFSVEIATELANLGDRRQGLRLPRRPVAGTSYTLTEQEWLSLKSFLSQRYAGSFYWRVVGQTADGAQVMSAANLVAMEYGTITLTGPADAGVVSAYQSPTFTFDYASTLTDMQLQISASPDFSDRSRTLLAPRRDAIPGGPGYSYTLDNAREWRRIKQWFRREPIPANWVLYWRAVGTTADGSYSAGSAAHRCTIDGGQINLTGPANGSAASLAGAPPAFMWTDSEPPWVDPRGRFGKYILQISASDQFDRRTTFEHSRRGTPDQVLVLDGRTWSVVLPRRLRLDVAAGPVTVYWRVLAQDQDRVLRTPSQQVWTLQLSP